MTILHPERISVGREEAARTCEAAALEIEMRGWTQGAMEREDGSVCMIGATIYGLGGLSSNAFRDARWLLTGDPYSHVPTTFNDSLAKSGAEVAFVLRWRASELRDGL